MAGVSFLRARASRTALIVILLLVSLASAVVIAIQAQYSASSQRAAVEGVLRDYSALVADEAIRRADIEIGYYGYFALSSAVVAEFQTSGTLAPSVRSALLSSPDSHVKRATTLAKGYFEFSPAPSVLVFQGAAPPAEVLAWLEERLAALSSQHSDGPFQIINLEPADAPRTFVVAPAHGMRGEARLIGFEVNLPELTDWFAVALTRQPLVPASLGHGKVTNGSVRLVIRDRRGAEIYRLGPEPLEGFSATKVFGDTYQKMFAGFTVQASIDPAIAGQLVLGGLPSSHLQLSLVLLLLDAALVVTAILQLRREMTLQKLRDQFVADVSHELRTPLTQIRMFTETLLLDRVRSAEETRRSLEIIDREVRRLVQLIENVLRFSRAERDADSFLLETRELASLIAETADDFASMLNGSDSQIELRLVSGLYAHVDAGALRQIVVNLLDNAVKYGRKGQQILISLDERNGQALLTVGDQGPGVPDADRERVFERFYRLDRDRKSAIAGTGIGLSVVRDLTTRLGGRCYVGGDDPGCGAKFVIEVPLCAVPSDAPRDHRAGTVP